MIDFENDAADMAAEPKPQTEVERAVEMAEFMVAKARKVKEIEERLKAEKQELLKLETEVLPELMLEIGLTEFTLKDGSKVAVKRDINCAITEVNRYDAHEWLKANGFAGLIKTQVSVEFDRGANEEAQQFAQTVTELRDGEAPKVLNTVHASTLKSFVKEQLEKGEMVPEDLFSLHVFNRATYKKP